MAIEDREERKNPSVGSRTLHGDSTSAHEDQARKGISATSDTQLRMAALSAQEEKEEELKENKNKPIVDESEISGFPKSTDTDEQEKVYSSKGRNIPAFF